MCGVSAIWALDEFTPEDGATDLIPRGHLWGDDVSPVAESARAVRTCMPAGSVVVFAGTLQHRGGASRGLGTRLGVTPQYCQPWLRQLENMALAVPPTAASRLSARVQELLGYGIAEPSFMGYVDGLHAKRLTDPEYARKRRAQRASDGSSERTPGREQRRGPHPVVHPAPQPSPRPGARGLPRPPVPMKGRSAAELSEEQRACHPARVGSREETGAGTRGWCARPRRSGRRREHRAVARA